MHAARHDFVTIVPGVRLADGDVHDQARVGTPGQVAARGRRRARGRARGHRGADDPRAAAQRVSRRGRATRSRRRA